MIYKLIKNKEFIGKEYLELVAYERSGEEVASILTKMFKARYKLKFDLYGYECCKDSIDE